MLSQELSRSDSNQYAGPGHGALFRSVSRMQKGILEMYISVVSLFVNDVDRAVDFYTQKLGWEKTMDVPMGDDARWVTIAPPGEKTMFTLSKGGPMWSPEKVGGFSGVIIEVDDVFKTCDQLKNAGVEFEEEARNEPWGGWAMFKDTEGNVHGFHSPAPAHVSSN